MVQLSVVIITFNEQHNIGRCIDSVAGIADEIIILDSFSTDNTAALARSKGAVVHQQSFAGYVEQKNKALALASCTHVLCLDADEAVDAQLKASIIQAKEQFVHTGYTMNRCTQYCGRFIRHGSWYPDKKLRLFRKDAGAWGGDNPHDKVALMTGSTVQHLKGDILHYSYHTIEEHVAQNNKFSSISAEALYARGKKTNGLKIFFKPLWAFIHGYILKAGFLDGFYGFVIAINVAHLTFLKYTKLNQLWKKKL